MEYDVDFAGRWDDLFAPFADNDADLLTTTLMYRHQCPDWPHWRTRGRPAVGARRTGRSAPCTR